MLDFAEISHTYIIICNSDDNAILLNFVFNFITRYGREDEEVMGLKFCNEAIMSLTQVWPVHCNHNREPNTPLQVSFEHKSVLLTAYTVSV